MNNKTPEIEGLQKTCKVDDTLRKLSNLEIQEIKVKEGLNNYHDFLSKYKNKKGEIHGNYLKFNKILEEIESKESVDPIKYLAYLYYIEKQSSIDLYDKYSYLKLYSDKKKGTFNRYLVNILGWKLRNVNQHSVNTNKKIRESNKGGPNVKKIHENEDEKVKNVINEIIKKCKNNIEGVLINNKKIKDKIIFLLKSLNIINNCDEKELADFTNTYKNENSFGFFMLSRVIYGLMENYYPGTNLKISSIKSVLLNNYNKFYKE